MGVGSFVLKPPSPPGLWPKAHRQQQQQTLQHQVPPRRCYFCESESEGGGGDVDNHDPSRNSSLLLSHNSKPENPEIISARLCYRPGHPVYMEPKTTNILVRIREPKWGGGGSDGFFHVHFGSLAERFGAEEHRAGGGEPYGYHPVMTLHLCPSHSYKLTAARRGMVWATISNTAIWRPTVTFAHPYALCATLPPFLFGHP